MRYSSIEGHNAKPPQNLATLDDIGLAQRKDRIDFRSIMQHTNRRIYCIARSAVTDDSQAEDVVPEADLRTFGSLREFRGHSSLATWLAPITLNKALGRMRRHGPMLDLAVFDAQSSSKSQVIRFPLMPQISTPGRATAHRQIRGVIEQAIDGPPQNFWVTFAITSNGV